MFSDTINHSLYWSQMVMVSVNNSSPAVSSLQLYRKSLLGIVLVSSIAGKLRKVHVNVFVSMRVCASQ